MSACEDIVETDVEDGRDAARADLTDCGGWITESVLETCQLANGER